MSGQASFGQLGSEAKAWVIGISRKQILFTFAESLAGSAGGTGEAESNSTKIAAFLLVVLFNGIPTIFRRFCVGNAAQHPERKPPAPAI
jgi:hypothetical protein